MQQSLYYNDIAEALALVCQGTALLTEDTDRTDTVTVGSNCLFSADDNVKLYIDDQNFTKKMVREVVGLTQVRFYRRLLGDFTVAAGTQLRLPRDVVPQAKQLLIGPLEPLYPTVCEDLPAIIIEPEIMKQPPDAGGNRTHQQHYGFEVYYIADYPDGLGDHRAVTAEPAKLFNAIMSDPYLGGTCYTTHVTEFQYWYDTQYEPTTGEQTVWISYVKVLAKRAVQWEQP